MSIRFVNDLRILRRGNLSVGWLRSRGRNLYTDYAQRPGFRLRLFAGWNAFRGRPTVAFAHFKTVHGVLERSPGLVEIRNRWSDDHA